MGQAAEGSATPGAAGASGGGLFAMPEVTHEVRPDGSMVLRSARRLGSVPRSIGALL
jgi:hypothetical protein